MKATLPPPMKTTIPRRHWAANVLLWSITICLVLLFLVEGGSKLLLDAGTIKNFHKWGYPTWMVFAVGLLEFPGAVLLLSPRLALLGAVLLVVDMVGAIVTGIVQGILPIILFSAFILLLVALVGWTRRERFVGWSLLQRRGRGATTQGQSLSETVEAAYRKERGND